MTSQTHAHHLCSTDAGETQACLDAAQEHVRNLEDSAVAQREEHEQALAAAQATLEAEQAAADRILRATQDESRAALEALNQQLQSAQVQLTV